MKITDQDFQSLKSFIQPILDASGQAGIERYETGNFPRADKVKDLQKRYCFDVLSASRVKIGDGIGIHGDINLYAYMDNDHIYTALKAICPKVTKRY